MGTLIEDLYLQHSPGVLVFQKVSLTNYLHWGFTKCDMDKIRREATTLNTLCCTTSEAQWTAYIQVAVLFGHLQHRM